MNTVIGALIAALISGLTATLVVLNGEAVVQLSDVTPLQWTILGIGIAITFLKDYQSISTRRLVNKVTKTGDGGGSV